MGQIVGGIETKNLRSLNGLQALVAASGHYVDPLNWRAGIQGIGDLEPSSYLSADDLAAYAWLNPAQAWGMVPPSPQDTSVTESADGVTSDSLNILQFLGLAGLGADLTPGLHGCDDNPIDPASRTS